MKLSNTTVTTGLKDNDDENQVNEFDHNKHFSLQFSSINSSSNIEEVFREKLNKKESRTIKGNFIRNKKSENRRNFIKKSNLIQKKVKKEFKKQKTNSNQTKNPRIKRSIQTKIKHTFIKHQKPSIEILKQTKNEKEETNTTRNEIAPNQNILKLSNLCKKKWEIHHKSPYRQRLPRTEEALLFLRLKKMKLKPRLI